MITIQGLVRRFGDVTAVDDLSFEVARGGILGLVGPNGAGKTTTLQCLSGILQPTAGRILISGYDLLQQPIETRRRLAFVPDEPLLFPQLTVTDHLDFFARLYRVKDGREGIAELLAVLGLEEKRHAFSQELSRGMKQKLMIASALLHHPEALILDEPLTGLDPAAMRKTKDIIRQTAADGCAVIVSSHLLHLVEELCDRILILHCGRSILEGTLGEVRAAVPELGANADLEDVFLHATGLGNEQ